MSSQSQNQNAEHEKWMRIALDFAGEAVASGDVPVGALVIHEGKIVGQGFNRKEQLARPTAHAEIIAIEEAAQKLGRWRLTGCSLYVTLEPCVMCSGAILHARLDRVIIGTPDPKTGAVQSLYQVLNDARLNHAPDVVMGVLQEEAAAQLKGFFRKLREERK